jgi:hypothetical protein
MQGLKSKLIFSLISSYRFPLRFRTLNQSIMKKIIIQLVFLTGLLSSCTEFRFAYAPVPVNTPGLKKKNDTRLGSSVSMGDFYLYGQQNLNANTNANFNANGAYAITNHFAVTASYTGTIAERDQIQYAYYNSSNTFADRIDYKRKHLEIGAGFFYPISRDKKTFLECFGGVGLGKLRIKDELIENNTVTSSNYFASRANTIFIQPSITFHWGKGSFLSLGGRYVNTGYTLISSTYSEEKIAEYNLKDITTKRIGFIEPFYSLNFGFKEIPWLRLQYQSGFSYKLSKHFVYSRIFQNTVGFTIDPLSIFLKRKK